MLLVFHADRETVQWTRGPIVLFEVAVEFFSLLHSHVKANELENLGIIEARNFK